MATTQIVPLVAPTTVAVAPTTTVLASLTALQLRSVTQLTIQIVNLNGAQTFTGGIYRRMTGMSGWAASQLGDFALVAAAGSAGDSAMADVFVEGTDLLEVRGTMSGAGGNVEIGITRKGVAP